MLGFRDLLCCGFFGKVSIESAIVCISIKADTSVLFRFITFTHIISNLVPEILILIYQQLTHFHRFVSANISQFV